MSDIGVEAMRERLLAELEEIETLRSASAEDRRAVTLDQQSMGRLSRMDAMQRQAMAQASETRRAARIGQIRAALQRIDEGEYGYCVDCDRPIPAGRLDVDPTAAKCVACADG